MRSACSSNGPRRWAGCLVFGLILATATGVVAQPTKMGSLLVKAARGISAEQTKGAITRAGGTWKKTISKLDLHVVQAPEAALEALAKNLKNDAAFVRVEMNRSRKARALPADPLYIDQWALPQIAWDSVYGVAAPMSWTKVAILDTGVDGSHADLVGALAAGTSFLDDSNGLTDASGHGTGLAGIVAARTNNGAGMAGVGYDFVQVMPVKVLSADGTGYDAEIIQGVLYAADAGAGVILMAFSGPGYSESLQEAIDYAWSRGVVLVAAAGNEGTSTPSYPAGDRGVMGVAGTDPSDAPAAGSNSGPAVFIAAPGVNIMATYPDGGYTAMNGTSAAAAIVAGSAALLRAIDPAATNGMIVNRLAKNAEAAGTQEQTGNGRVQLARAATDTTTDSIQPAGAAPLGNGGPFVGPYKTAATTVAINGTTNSPATATADASGNATLTVGYNFTTGVTGTTTGFTYTVTLVNGGTSFTLGSSDVCQSPGTYSGSAVLTLGGAASNTQTWTLRVDTGKCGGTGSGANASQSNWVTVNPPAPPGGSISSITVGAQNGTVTYGTAATPTYAVAATRGSNGGITGNYAVSGLPVGVTGAFNPAACDSTGGNPIPSTTLTLTVGTAVPVNGYSFTVSCANASNSGTLTVQKATPTATLAVSNTPRPYTGLPQAATVSISSSSVPGAVANILTGGAATKTIVGSYAVTADFVPTDTANYNTLTGLSAGSFAIQQVPLAVNAVASSKVYGALDPIFTWTYSGFVSGENSSNVTITGSASCSRTLGETATGSPYTITCAPGTLASTNYSFTTGTTAQFDITKVTLAVNAVAASKVYGGADPAFTWTLSGFITGENSGNVTITGSANCTRTSGETVAAIPYTITCAPGTLETANYSFATGSTANFTITKVPLAVNAVAAGKVYGGTDPTFTWTLSGFITGENSGNVTITGSANCTRTSGESVANSPYTITCAPGTLDTANYSFATGTTAQFNITRAPLAVNAVAASKVYGGTDPAFAWTLSGFITGENSGNVTVTGSANCTRTLGESVANSPYTITCAPGTLDTANYSFTTGTTAQFNITRAPLAVNAVAASKVYGGTDPAFTWTLSGFITGENSGNVTITGSASCSRTLGESVANSPYTITCAAGTLDAANYSFSTGSTARFDITKVPLAVNAVANGKVYGTADPAFTWTYSGFITGENSGNVTINGAANCTRTSGENVAAIPYTITCAAGTLSATNYSFTTGTSANFLITARPVTASIIAANKEFDNTTAAVITSCSLNPASGSVGVIAGDVGLVTCQATNGQFANLNAGTWPVMANVALSGTKSGNYALTSSTAATTATISVRDDAVTRYIGQTLFVTSGTSSTTAQVALTASVTDPTGLALVGAKVTFIDLLTTKVLAKDVPVAAIPGGPVSSGTANTIVTLSSGQYGSESYVILVKLGGNYDNSGQLVSDKTATVVVTQPAAANTIRGGGTFIDTDVTTVAGTFATALTSTYSIGLSFNSKGTNLVGQIKITIPQADGSEIVVKSNSLTTMAVTNVTGGRTATVYSKASIYRTNPDLTLTAIDGNVTLRLDVVDMTGSANDGVGFTVLSSKDSKLYFSNDWYFDAGTKTWKTRTQAPAPGTIAIGG